MRIALYARCSTRDKNQDVENQLVQLRQFCLTQGWVIVEEYIDYKTGKNDNRDGFTRMFADAAKRKFDLVLFWALDRLSREGPLGTLKHLERLTSYGVGYKSFTEQYLDSIGIFRDAVISILATIAKQERIRLSERVVAGLERARARGRTLGRRHVQVDQMIIKNLRANGHTWAQIKQSTGVSKGTAQRAMQALSAQENTQAQ